MERSRTFVIVLLLAPLACLIGLGIFAMSMNTDSDPIQISSNENEAQPNTTERQISDTYTRAQESTSEETELDRPRSREEDTGTTSDNPAGNSSVDASQTTATESEISRQGDVGTPEAMFNSRFAEQDFDPEWSRTQQERIRESVAPALEEVYGWVEDLECRKTLCRLTVRRSGMENPSGQFFANIAGRLTQADYVPEGAVLILRTDHSDGNPRITLGVSRHENGLR